MNFENAKSKEVSKLLEEVELLFLPLSLLAEDELEAALRALLRAPEEVEARTLALTCRGCGIKLQHKT